MTIIEISKPVNSSDCKNQLNKYLGNKDWKRLYKIGGDEESLRCFKGNDGSLALIGTDFENYYIHGDIRDIKPEIDSIRKIAKYYHTYDYGEIFYNPYDKMLQITCGDGGYVYSKSSISDDKFEELIEVDNFVEFNSHNEVSFLDNVEWADEWFPESDKFVFIGRINMINF